MKSSFHPTGCLKQFSTSWKREKSKVNLHGFILLMMHKIPFPFLFSRSWNRFLDCGAIILNNFSMLLHPFFFFTYDREYEEIFSSGKFYFKFIFYLKFSFFFLFFFFKPKQFLAGFHSFSFFFALYTTLTWTIFYHSCMNMYMSNDLMSYIFWIQDMKLGFHMLYVLTFFAFIILFLEIFFLLKTCWWNKIFISVMDSQFTNNKKGIKLFIYQPVKESIQK